VVALDEDVGRLRMLDDNPDFGRRQSIGPFRVYARARPTLLARAVTATHWTLEARAAGWTPTGVAYYPLWQARQGSKLLQTRRGDMADLQVMSDGSPAVIELRYGPGTIEYAGIGISAAAILAWLFMTGRSRRAADDSWDDVDPQRSPR
jgi:hypothetical protein